MFPYQGSMYMHEEANWAMTERWDDSMGSREFRHTLRTIANAAKAARRAVLSHDDAQDSAAYKNALRYINENMNYVRDYIPPTRAHHAQFQEFYWRTRTYHEKTKSLAKDKKLEAQARQLANNAPAPAPVPAPPVVEEPKQDVNATNNAVMEQTTRMLKQTNHLIEQVANSQRDRLRVGSWARSVSHAASVRPESSVSGWGRHYPSSNWGNPPAATNRQARYVGHAVVNVHSNQQPFHTQVQQQSPAATWGQNFQHAGSPRSMLGKAPHAHFSPGLQVNGPPPGFGLAYPPQMQHPNPHAGMTPGIPPGPHLNPGDHHEQNHGFNSGHNNGWNNGQMPPPANNGAQMHGHFAAGQPDNINGNNAGHMHNNFNGANGFPPGNGFNGGHNQGFPLGERFNGDPVEQLNNHGYQGNNHGFQGGNGYQGPNNNGFNGFNNGQGANGFGGPGFNGPPQHGGPY
ncbi:hypothetical protein EJ08DRAFT_201196 [Tothia fuscella]|uniref:Uncharacterized protein n=1 Tax=Tothia fuscella TaxID=1048955 RepID=A0A9P4NT29_9PEZI|nr:hypothetical protein EJ08DRAFT_201196 [Tothia fuscella]